MDFPQSKLRAEGALSVGPIMHDDYVSTVSADRLSCFSANFEKPRQARKLPEIPASSTAKVSKGLAGGSVPWDGPGGR